MFALRELFGVCCILFICPGLSIGASSVDSLLTLSQSQLESGEGEEAVRLLETALKLEPDGVRIHLLLGHAYLQGGKTNRALDAYREALEWDAASAEAQTGIAEVHYRKARGLVRSMHHARKAVSEARRATRLDPAYVPAYLLLGRSYEQLNENYVAAVRAYSVALEREPDNLEAASLLGAAYIELRNQTGRDRRASKPLLGAATLSRLEGHLDASRFLPILAQIRFNQGQSQSALDSFERYIDGLLPEEQVFYRDIEPVATKDETEAYSDSAPGERRDFLRVFWGRRDLDPLTEVNERLFEHYRRIWYSLQHFGRVKIPWDARGKVYVRYGEPEYRSRSGEPPPVMSPTVEQVKERLAMALYGPEGMDESFPGPVYPVRSNQSFVGELRPAQIHQVDLGGNLLGEGFVLESEPGEESLEEEAIIDAFERSQLRPENQHHFLPVTSQGDMTIVSWESWVYTLVEGGLEITFTDEMGNGIYDFAPIPDYPEEEGSIGLHRYSQYVYYAPMAIAERTASAIPEFYTPGGPMSGLGFHYDYADFRGHEGKTRVEVYYGINPTEMGSFASGDTATILADCAVILTDSSYSRIQKARELFRYSAVGHRKWPEGAFVPYTVSLEVPPGDYVLTVRVNDLVAKRKGIFRRSISVEPYGSESLQLSDIQLGWHISETGGDEMFQKGDVWVIPMPTQAYGENQSAYAFYELYNLSRNAFGQTRYRVTYTISAEDLVRPFNLVRSSFSAITKAFRREDETQVEISFDQSGDQATTSGYFELSLEKVKPGFNRLTVRVEDLNSGQSAAKEIHFRYKK
jgi:GWxTD domain-containing protein